MAEGEAIESEDESHSGNIVERNIVVYTNAVYVEPDVEIINNGRSCPVNHHRHHQYHQTCHHDHRRHHHLQQVQQVQQMQQVQQVAGNLLQNSEEHLVPHHIRHVGELRNSHHSYRTFTDQDVQSCENISTNSDSKVVL